MPLANFGHLANRLTVLSGVEAPRDLPAAIDALNGRDAVVLVDCLTLWTSNILLNELNFPAVSKQLMDALLAAKSPIILVSNEVGMGIVPDNALARRFRDMAGRLNQDIAAIADRAEIMFAGLVVPLKG